MIVRLACTLGLLLFAIGAFLGAGPTHAGLMDPFGLFFLGLAVLAWFAWKPMANGLGSDTGVWDAFSRNVLRGHRRTTSSSGSAS